MTLMREKETTPLLQGNASELDVPSEFVFGTISGLLAVNFLMACLIRYWTWARPEIGLISFVYKLASSETVLSGAPVQSGSLRFKRMGTLGCNFEHCGQFVL